MAPLGIFFAWLTEKNQGYEGGHIGFIKEVPKKSLRPFVSDLSLISVSSFFLSDGVWQEAYFFCMKISVPVIFSFALLCVFLIVPFLPLPLSLM